MTVADLGRRMSSAEFSDWLAFMALEHEDKVDAVKQGVARPVVVVTSLDGT